MKKNKIILAAAVFTTAALLSACGGKKTDTATTQAESQTEEATTTEEASSESTEAETESQAEAAELSIKVSTVDASVNRDDGATEIVASYDTLSLEAGADSHPELESALNDFNDGEADRMEVRLDNLQDAADANAGTQEDFDPYEIDAETDVVSANENYVSLLVTEYTDTLGDAPEISARSVTYNSKDGNEVELADIADTSVLADKLIQRIKDEYTDASFSDDFESTVKSLTESGDLVWNIDKNGGLMFTFMDGEIASADDGEISVTFDRTDDADIFKN